MPQSSFNFLESEVTFVTKYVGRLFFFFNEDGFTSTVGVNG
jgi:hypothetical protein